MSLVLASLLLHGAVTPGDRFTRFGGFALNGATLAEVQVRHGPSRVRRSGDAGESEAWICYATPFGEVQFNSGEMGGGEELLGFTLSSTHTSSDCPSPTEQLPDQISGLRLGVTREAFIAAIGQPVEWTGSVAKAWFEGDSTNKDGQPTTILVSVTATFHAGKLTRLAVWRIEST